MKQIKISLNNLEEIEVTLDENALATIEVNINKGAGFRVYKSKTEYIWVNPNWATIEVEDAN